MPTTTCPAIPWTVSLSYDIANSGIIPYVTVSEQATVIAGQGAELTVGNVASGGAFDSSELTEFGVKGELAKTVGCTSRCRTTSRNAQISRRSPS